MKKQSFWAMMLWSSIHLSAQITVPASTFPAASDQLRYVEPSIPGIASALITPPGFNQFWDMSALTAQSTVETHYRAASEGIYHTAFPGATMMVKSGADEYYYSATGAKFHFQGYTTTTVGGVTLNSAAIFLYIPFLAERHAPLNLFDIHQQSTNQIITWKLSDLPAGTIIDEFNLVDSVRMRIDAQVLEVVDAYGTLRLPGPIPGSDFPVLRIKKTAYRTVAIDIFNDILGWQHISQLPPSGAWATLPGIDTTLSYHFYNDISKEEIVVMTLNDEQNAATQVLYKNTAPASSVFEATDDVWRLQVFPNPASSEVTIRCAQAPMGMYRLTLFNPLGVVINESMHEIAENQSIGLPLPDGLNGMYFCQLTDEHGRVVAKSRLVAVE